MKVLFIDSLYHPNIIGGAERALQSLAEAFLKVGHVPVVISTSPQPGTHVDYVNGVKVYYVGLKNLYWPFRSSGRPEVLKPIWHALDTHNSLMVREAARILDVEHPDLVHTHNLMGFSVLIWPYIKRRNLPLVHTLHDYYLLCPRASMFDKGTNCVTQEWDCKLYSIRRLRSSRLVDAVVSVSGFVLDRHIMLGAFAGVTEKHVIPNVCRSQQNSVRQTHIQNRPIRFGFIGQLSTIKGVELLLGVLEKMPQQGWELLVAGKGSQEYESRLRERYKLPAVRYLGFVSPETFFPNIDVLIVPSVWHEPFSLVVIEAFAHGVPVIGSRRGGIPELIDEMRTGILFDPDDADSLQRAINRILLEPSLVDDMRPYCFQKAGSFSQQGVVHQYQAVYTTAMYKDDNRMQERAQEDA